ncbi:MAG: hypothetical protein ACMUHM_01240 [Thermoplasmatota archaeon]
MRSNWIIPILLTISVLFSGLSIIGGSDGSESAPWFTPEIANGEITSDQTWNGTFYTTDIVIKEGVTVNITSGSTWRHPQNSDTYVEGTLLIEGTEENPVVIEELVSGQGWDGIKVSYTGRIVFKNFTMSGLADDATGITMVAYYCWIENGSIEGGRIGITAGETFGGHTMINLDFFEQSTSAISILGNLYPTLIKGVRTFDVGLYAIALIFVESVTLQDIALYRTQGIGLFLSSYSTSGSISNIQVNNITIIGTDTSPSLYGIVFDIKMENIVMDGVDIDYCGLGLGIRSYPGSDVSINDLWIGSGVGKGIFQGNTNYGIDLKINDSSIQSVPDIIDLETEGSNTTVDFFDTYWTETSNFDVKGGGAVNVHWSSDVRVVDGRGEPADVGIDILDDEGTELYSGREADGLVEDFTFKSLVITEDGEEKVRHDIHVSSSIQSKNDLWRNGTWVDRSTSAVFIQMDMWPQSSLAPMFYMDEDEGSSLDLSDHFEDPDDDVLNFEVWTGPELVAEMPGGASSGQLNVATSEEHWAGISWLKVRAADPNGNFTEVNVTVEVMPENDPPLPKGAFGPFITPEDIPLTIDLGDHFYDVEGDEIIYNALDIDNCTLSWDGTNITVVPAENWFGLLGIPINASDGEDITNMMLFINVTPVNDPPRFDAPVDWNVTIDPGIVTKIDIGPWISDVEGDSMIISADPGEHVTINGTVLELLYDAIYSGDSEMIRIDVNDYLDGSSAYLMVNVKAAADDDDVDDDIDDDDNDTLGIMRITSKEDGWLVEIEGSEGQALWVVIEDSEGGRASFPMTYESGKYSAEISADEAGEGNDIWISVSEDGEPLQGASKEKLPSLKEEDDGSPLWLFPLLIGVVSLVILLIIFILSRRKGTTYEE